MKKEMQNIINEKCLEKFNEAYEYIGKHDYKIYPFRKCSAELIKSDKYIFLRSYRTLIAVYDVEENVVYDCLRYMYGSTNTSNQHIWRFYHDMHANKMYRWERI